MVAAAASPRRSLPDGLHPAHGHAQLLVVVVVVVEEDTVDSVAVLEMVSLGGLLLLVVDRVETEERARSLLAPVFLHCSPGRLGRREPGFTMVLRLRRRRSRRKHLLVLLLVVGRMALEWVG